MKIWRPKDPRAIAIVKLTLWAGLFTWSLFTLLIGILYARQFALIVSERFSFTGWTKFLSEWIVPVWIVFTTLMLIWAVWRFANRRLRKKEKGDKDGNNSGTI